MKLTTSDKNTINSALITASKIVGETQIKAAKCSYIRSMSAVVLRWRDLGSLIVSVDGSVLYADKDTDFQQHVQAFALGLRTPLKSALRKCMSGSLV